MQPITVEPANLVPPAEESEVQKIARQQAEGDLALLAALAERKASGNEPTLADVAEQEEFKVTQRVPMNRRERRMQVQLYASLLAQSERQTPEVNSTIRPKSKRRRRRQ